MALANLLRLRDQYRQPRCAMKAQFDVTTWFDVSAPAAPDHRADLIVHGRSDHITPAALRVPGNVPDAKRQRPLGRARNERRGHYTSTVVGSAGWREAARSTAFVTERAFRSTMRRETRASAGAAARNRDVR
jgi:hypothetical protein